MSGSSAVGNVSITQTDVAANPAGDTATVSGDTVGGSITIMQGNASGDTAFVDATTTVTGNVTITQLGGNDDTATVESTPVGGNVTITQGSGSGDTATISGVTAGGNITITQSDVAGNALGDTAKVLDVTAGTHTGSPATEAGGLVTITQGNAPGDVALVQGGSSNNVVITQGNNVQVPNGSTVASDVAEINDTAVTSDVTINQGTSNSAGNYVAAIGFDYLGLISGAQTSSSVTVGGDTLIDQQGANNQVFLGDAAPSSFTTFWLDVFTGSGGGAYVQVTNTTVFFGPYGVFSLIGPYTIEGGLSNTYVDNGGNSGVTADPTYFNS